VDESMPFGREPTWTTFVDALKEEFYHVGNYHDQYMTWMTQCQKRDQTVSEYTNIFHTLCSKLGIKDFEQHLVHSNRDRFLGHLLTRRCLSLCNQN
jgi:hypothetical protein